MLMDAWCCLMPNQSSSYTELTHTSNTKTDLQTQSRLWIIVPFDRPHIISCWSSIVTMSLILHHFRDIIAYYRKIRHHVTMTTPMWLVIPELITSPYTHLSILKFWWDPSISFWETGVRKSTIKKTKKNISEIYSLFDKFAKQAKKVVDFDLTHLHLSPPFHRDLWNQKIESTDYRVAWFAMILWAGCTNLT